MSDTNSSGSVSRPELRYYTRRLYSCARGVVRSVISLESQLCTSRHYTLTSLFIAVVSGAILLAGARPGSNGLRSIYVLSLAPHPKEVALAEQDLWSNLTLQLHEATQRTNTEVRVGYFGLCARLIDESDWECLENGKSLFTRLGREARDTIDILHLADNFNSDVMFPGLVIGAVALSVLCCIGLGTTIGWHRESGRHIRSGSDISIESSNTAVMRMYAATSALASALKLAAALWQHVAAAGAVAVVEAVTQGYVSGHVGRVAAALVWLSFTTTAVATLGTLGMCGMLRLYDEY